jgi:hypothetical protein
MSEAEYHRNQSQIFHCGHSVRRHADRYATCFCRLWAVLFRWSDHILTVSTGHGALRNTAFRDASHEHVRDAVRPWVAMTMRSEPPV